MDPTLAEFELYLNEGERAETLPEPGNDPLATFFEAARLAGIIGWNHVDQLQKETEELESFADAALQNTRATNDREETITDDSHVLAKTMASDRRRQNLAVWMHSQLALGKSARQLIEHAALHDATTAQLLTEIASELEKAA